MSPRTILPDLMIEPLVRQALIEDFGHGGDITAALIPARARLKASFVTRAEGVLAGLGCARLAMQLVGAGIKFEPEAEDGTPLRLGQVIAVVEGPAHAVLMAERVALNYLGHLSGIASLTQQFVTGTNGTHARIAATRKTTPGLRALEKYAVACGGGLTHRYGLDDCVLIKDNHVAAMGGIGPALKAAREVAGPWRKLELEVDSLAQLDEALRHDAAMPDIVMCDNFRLEDLKAAVARIEILGARRPLIEASGGVNLGTVAAIAATGVDLISVGALTHSAPVLDIGLDAV